MSAIGKELGGVPIREAYRALGIGLVTGQSIVNSGELESYMIKSRRYTTPAAIERFIRKRIEESAKETPEQRAAKVAPAVAARARKRAEAQ